MYYLIFFFLHYTNLACLFFGFVFVCPSPSNSTKMEVEKIVQEKTEMQRHYVMVSRHSSPASVLNV